MLWPIAQDQMNSEAVIQIVFHWITKVGRRSVLLQLKGVSNCLALGPCVHMPAYLAVNICHSKTLEN
jgi:hypothetical protein